MVAIKDLEMPRNCADCQIWSSNRWEHYCDITTYQIDLDDEENRHAGCPLVEAIPKDQYEARLKADLVAILTELQLEIEEHEESIIGHYGKETKESDFPSHKIERNNGRKECVDLIQQKINELKG